MRRQLNFVVEGCNCAASLDTGTGPTGLLMVSGGNEIRSGAHRGMAWLAAELAAAGYPVLRFDRRGIGDSEGNNGGFESSAPDIMAALALFRSECPEMRRIVAFGNCDAATALLLHHDAGGPDALVLANPWTIEAFDDQEVALPSPDIVRARYARKLKDPREWVRLLRGGVNIRKLMAGLRSAATRPPASGLAERMRQALQREGGAAMVPITILLAERDATALAFQRHWRTTFRAESDRIELQSIDSASHGFADDAAREWLKTRLSEALARAN